MKRPVEPTEDNYYDHEMDMLYWSASQYKDFDKCSACAMAKLKGKYKQPESDALLRGQVLDKMMEGDEAWNKFKFVRAKDLYKRDGSPYAWVIDTINAYKRAMADPVFESYMSGDHQTIMTGELIPGIWFKGKFDSYFPGDKIVDLKYMRNMDPMWVNGEKKTFIEAWGYHYQMAIYQRLAAYNTDGTLLPCYIACVTKESTPQIDVIELPQYLLENAWGEILHYIPIYDEIKKGLREPERCEHCQYCISTKVLSEPTKYEELLKQIA